MMWKLTLQKTFVLFSKCLLPLTLPDLWGTNKKASVEVKTQLNIPKHAEKITQRLLVQFMAIGKKIQFPNVFDFVTLSPVYT